jgi:predicted TIM-barrel fold metal-dependent hydrolase
MAAQAEFRGNAYRSPDALAAWHALRKPVVVEAALPIVDPHHHLWLDHRGRYGVDEFVADLGGHNIVATIFVECEAGYDAAAAEMAPVGETRFVRKLTREAREQDRGPRDLCAGIVGFVDLRLGDAVRPVLEAHIDAGQGRFRGMRHSTAWDPYIGKFAYRNSPKGLLYDDSFRAGYAALKSYGLVFDAWFYHPQIPDLLDLARSFPDIPVVVNHFAGVLGVGPYERGAVFADWQGGMKDLARLPNVFMKMGGLGMPATGSTFHLAAVPPDPADLAQAWRRYIDCCVEAFGPQRCMFESNFPVDKQTTSYSDLWNAFKLATKGYSPSERARLFSQTAVQVYRLDLVSPIE